ncbi:protein gamma response 1 isoform X1 [Carica papaya]|uniref:protein gamma response 1 isoform X1 n=2 Tax=Carica papaya TaxID=3649 RepID=UPI000B8CF571|nr:protein gamma response 1 isoform X1 [Carica papaya]
MLFADHKLTLFLSFSLEMEGLLQNIPKEGCSIDSVEAKYVSGLSTVLVATIQEAKDRISQIEYIFCSQLFPNFQSKYKGLQKIYSEAQKAAEEAWKEKGNNMLRQIEKLQLENQQILNENQSLKLEKRKQLEEHEGNTKDLVVKLRSQEMKIDELQCELKKKSKEVDDGMELQNRLLQMVREKASELVCKSKQAKEYEEKTGALIGKVKSLEEKIGELQDELREKTEKASEGEQTIENLLKKIEFLTLEIANGEQLLNDQEKEKKRLTTKLECLEEDVSRLQEKLKEKIKAIEGGKKVQEEFLLKIDSTASGMLENKQWLEEDDKQRNLLLSKVKCLEEKVKELNEQIELKNSELQSETEKKLKHINAYKRLKSQYIFLLEKSDLTTDNMLPQSKLENGSDPSKRHQSLVISPVFGNKNQDAPVSFCGSKKVTNNSTFKDNRVEEKIIKTVPTSGICSSTSKSSEAPKSLSNGKSSPAAGRKRLASSWRETRHRQLPGGADPHDDFLDTPFENIKENLKKAMKEDTKDLGDTVPKDTKPDSSDDETQDMNVDHSPQQHAIQAAGARKRNFKYVEPVRKKAEREILKGIDCKQCKKFYDAVLPNNASKDNDGNKQNIRCEHHDGVSRHRYKYIPPMTPEGFWNIGFESEI